MDENAKTERVWLRRPQLQIGGNGREITPHGTVAFPMQLYYVDVASFAGARTGWHWHDECEFVTVFSGSMKLEVAGDTVILNRNDSGFVNSSQVHSMSVHGSGPCQMISVVFAPRILSGAPDSIFESKYVRPVIHHSGGPLPAFRAGTTAQEEILQLVARIEEWYGSEDFARELALRSCLSELWPYIYERFRDDGGTQKTGDLYIKDLLTFIHTHYAEQLSLEQIAASAGISVRTCCRSFREQLHTTAFAYLLQYRIGKAADMLLETSTPIVDVAYENGFTDAAYFSRAFRKATGCAPSAYRRQAGEAH